MTTMVPIGVLVFWIGLKPEPFLNVMHVSVDQLIRQVHNGQPIELSEVFGRP